MNRLAGEHYRDETAFVVPWNWWDGIGDLPAEQLEPDIDVPGHAGAVETAMMLYLARDLVCPERFDEATVEFESRFDHPTFAGFDFADLTEQGSHGDARAASAEGGAALFDASVESLDGIPDWLVELPPEDCRPEPHK